MVFFGSERHFDAVASRLKLFTSRKLTGGKGKVQYLMGSCECISMGRGVPPSPPRVRASMKPRTTAHLRAVPNSSRVYLANQTREKKNINSRASRETTLPQTVGRRNLRSANSDRRERRGGLWELWWRIKRRERERRRSRILLPGAVRT
ncbi:hypothetical protein EYF80_014704 [Liparis tanakae]|uniref:Uncharacterized protein n=1 Tax=Liparis tanakae TaxID=230148 RepID=A0A4Z2IBP4_9TELE|nr:hypothetical protein EYF80_014704 [Liparis tanakae]